MRSSSPDAGTTTTPSECLLPAIESRSRWGGLGGELELRDRVHRNSLLHDGGLDPEQDRASDSGLERLGTIEDGCGVAVLVFGAVVWRVALLAGLIRSEARGDAGIRARERCLVDQIPVRA